MGDLFRQVAANAVEAGTPFGLFFGTVQGTSPLEVMVEDGLMLPASALYLASAVLDYEVDMTVAHETEAALDGVTATHTHAVSEGSISGWEGLPFEHRHAYKGKKRFLAHQALEVGERVVLLRQQGGQKYLILDRVRDGNATKE